MDARLKDEKDEMDGHVSSPSSFIYQNYFVARRSKSGSSNANPVFDAAIKIRNAVIGSYTLEHDGGNVRAMASTFRLNTTIPLAMLSHVLASAAIDGPRV